ncbi:MAG: DUF4357 domain-containing protein [Desulforhabdus sp.]|jgi:hypothetical protein|nr:DUF4357 domain-containing protein [Desulforhabdus sp.]
MTDDISDLFNALNQWLEQQSRISKKPTGLSTEERKQLQAVNKAVEQLRRSGVPVPEDLRSLKLKLSAQDSSSPDNIENDIRLGKVERLIEDLGKTLKTARLIRDKLKSVGQVGGGPKKYYGIALLDLLQAGLLSVDDRCELQWLKDGPVLEGRIQPDGTIMVKESGKWQPFASLSTAASGVAGRSLNGWKHWRRVNNDGTCTPLEEVRAMYMNEEADG